MSSSVVRGQAGGGGFPAKRDGGSTPPVPVELAPDAAADDSGFAAFEQPSDAAMPKSIARHAPRFPVMRSILW
jgi:hypothetical protein